MKVTIFVTGNKCKKYIERRNGIEKIILYFSVWFVVTELKFFSNIY